MSTNFYLRRTKPILTFPEFHVGKRSFGWKALFQANNKAEDSFMMETQRPIIQAPEDIKAAVESGEWELVDEYDGEYTYQEFIDAMLNDYECERIRQSHVEYGAHEAADGTEWTHDEFS